jgi:uncharacterized ferredoxin-like protein
VEQRADDCGFRIADFGFEKNKKCDAEAEIRGKESWQRTAGSRQKKKDRRQGVNCGFRIADLTIKAGKKR